MMSGLRPILFGVLLGCLSLSASQTDPQLFAEVPLLVWKPIGDFIKLQTAAANRVDTCQNVGGIPESFVDALDEEDTIVEILLDSLSLEDFRGSEYEELRRSYETANEKTFLPRSRPLLPAQLAESRSVAYELSQESAAVKGKKLVVVELGEGGDEEILKTVKAAMKLYKRPVFMLTGKKASVPLTSGWNRRSKRSANHESTGHGSAHAPVSKAKKAPAAEGENTIFSSPCLRLSATDARFVLYKVDGKQIKSARGKAFELPLDADGDSTSVCTYQKDNSTSHSIEWRNAKSLEGIKSVLFAFKVVPVGSKGWKVTDARLTYNGKIGGTDPDVPAQMVGGSIPLNTGSLRGKNNYAITFKDLAINPATSDEQNTAGLRFENLKFQASTTSSAAGHLQFGLVRSEQGQVYFSTGILIALFLMLIFLLIMAWAFSMMGALRTNDQFDDPKGKTITVPQVAD